MINFFDLYMLPAEDRAQLARWLVASSGYRVWRNQSTKRTYDNVRIRVAQAVAELDAGVPPQEVQKKYGFATNSHLQTAVANFRSHRDFLATSSPKNLIDFTRHGLPALQIEEEMLATQVDPDAPPNARLNCSRRRMTPKRRIELSSRSPGSGSKEAA